METNKPILQTDRPYTLRGRVQRLFGVYIPPKKIFNPKRYVTLRFVLTGVIPSKKNDFFAENNYRQIMNKAFAMPNPKQYLYENVRSWIRGSKKYLEWLDAVETPITEQKAFWREKYDLVFPLNFVSIKTYYYFADRMVRDFISKDESVYDMLVKKRVIEDDNYGVQYKDASDGACYVGEINDHIAIIDVTAAFF